MAHDHGGYIQETEALIQENIEKHGFFICFFEASYLPAFAYTIGLYETYKHPEIIVFGLKQDLMGSILNSLGDDIKEGKTFKTNELYDDFIQDFPIQFLNVQEHNYPSYLGFGGRHYNNTFDFPVLQLVWTDKQSKFPWESGFNENWILQQPLLDRNEDFKFLEHKNLGVYTTKAVLEGSPITCVHHDEDGDWQFLSSDSDVNEAQLVCLEDLVKMDKSLNEIFDLGYGKCAFRDSVDDDWQIEDSEDSED